MGETSERDHDAIPNVVRQDLQARIEEGELEPPMLPKSAQQAILCTSNDDYDPAELTEIIQADPALAAQLLRTANSALYGGRHGITSLSQAITHLGVLRVREAVLLVCCRTRLFRVRDYEDMAQSILRRSIAAAHFAREIARVKRLAVEEAFLFGLLHDVGRPIVLQELIDITERHAVVLDRKSIEHLLDHESAEVGARVILDWELSPRIAGAIRHQHSPKDARETQREAAALTGLARSFALLAESQEGLGGIDVSAFAEHPAVAMLHMYPDEIRAVLATDERLNTALEVLA